MSLVSDLKDLTSNVYEDDGGAWRTYVIDHIPYLQSKAKTAFVDRTYIDKFRYDVTWFLRENGIGPEYAWIFRLINNITSDFSFEEDGMYYMPPVSTITEMYDSYLGSKKVRSPS